MNFLRWLMWVFSPKPRIRVTEIDGLTRLIRDEIYEALKNRETVDRDVR